MQTSIDRLGRVVVPKAIRDRLRLVGGETLDVEERDGVVTLRPAPTPFRIVETDEGVVAQPFEELPPLTDEIVRETLERTRR
jgi:AbrB family looped-hinge helix DNA binding protein